MTASRGHCFNALLTTFRFGQQRFGSSRALIQDHPIAVCLKTAYSCRLVTSIKVMRDVARSSDPALIEALAMQTHQTTGHIAYSGMMVELTEALSSMPCGGQCIMSGQTYQKAFPQLQALAEVHVQPSQVQPM